MPKSKTVFLIRLTLIIGAGMAVGADNAQQAKRYVITDYEAVGDGKTLNTQAIQAIIDRASSEGGGVVVVPKGTFLTGAIFLKQGVNLQIEKDGVLKGTTDQKDYPPVKTRWEGAETQRFGRLAQRRRSKRRGSLRRGHDRRVGRGVGAAL